MLLDLAWFGKNIISCGSCWFLPSVYLLISAAMCSFQFIGNDIFFRKNTYKFSVLSCRSAVLSAALVFLYYFSLKEVKFWVHLAETIEVFELAFCCAEVSFVQHNAWFVNSSTTTYSSLNQLSPANLTLNIT